MQPLNLHPFHAQAGARFLELDGQETVLDYGAADLEYAALRRSAGVLDLSQRGRLCLTGTDRQRFLHGQVTNDVNSLDVGEGCYAVLVTAKGKMVADLHIYRLEQELLLDFEPGLSEKVQQRLEQYIIADDVQVIDAAPHYGLLTVQGPRAGKVIERLGLIVAPPSKEMTLAVSADEKLGEIYVINSPRLGSTGYDLFTPIAALPEIIVRLQTAAAAEEGRLCGWQALEMARIEEGIPRFGADMDESNLAPEAGLEARAISYRKGCYIGQEVIARIRTYGQVAKMLRGLVFPGELPSLPKKGDKLFVEGKEVGYVTSAIQSPARGRPVALAYVRREHNLPGTELTVRTEAGESTAQVVEIPFR